MPSSPVTPYPYFITRTRVRTQTQIIREIDPEWRPAMTGQELEFEFSNGRKFYGNPVTRYPSED